MRPTQRTQTVEGNLDGQVIEMGIDENSLAHIMSVLTDLYSDTELAIIREYSCNARDSHTEAGQVRPIEVTTPSTFSQDFIVRDFGIGLSIDEISEIYSRYGASTKRGTDTQTGMLGLGCKSGLTYAPSFQVTSWKNGVKTQVLVSRNAEGVGVMEVLDTCASNEPTGVEIRIPTQASNRLERKAVEFFQYWEDGSVLLNGKAPARIETVMDLDNFSIVAGGQDLIIMGGVTYPAGSPFSRNIYGSVVVWAEIGDVNFTPAREELMYTNKTKAFIEAQTARIQKALADAKIKDERACSTAAEAFDNANKWRRVSRSFDFTFRGTKVPSDIPVPTGVTCHVWDVNGWSRRHKGSLQKDATRVGARSIVEGVVVTGCETQTVSRGMLDRLDKWAEDQGIDFAYGVFVSKVFGDPWVKPAHTVDYDTIRKIKMPRIAVASNGNKVERTHPYDLLDEDGRLVETASISQNVIYGSPSDFPVADYRTADYRGPLYALAKSLGYDVVLIGKNRWEKFTRDFPHAVAIDTFFQNHYDTLTKNLTTAGKYRNKASGSDREMADFLFGKSGVSVVTDPDLRRDAGYLLDVQAVTDVTEIERIERGIQAAGLRFRGYRNSAKREWCKEVKVKDVPTGERLLSAYPMCYNSRKQHRDHQIEYINAVHSASTKGN
jgi:hypothetical protein